MQAVLLSILGRNADPVSWPNFENCRNQVRPNARRESAPTIHESQCMEFLVCDQPLKRL